MSNPMIPPIFEAVGKVTQPMKRGRFSEAVAILEDAVARYGGVPAAYAEIASACMLAGDLEKGVAAANEAIRQSEGMDGYVARAFGLLGALNYLKGLPAAAGTAFARYRDFTVARRADWAKVAGRLARLYTPSLLETASRCGANINALLRDSAEKSTADLVWYPDGTLLVRGAASYPFYEQVFLLAFELNWLLTGEELSLNKFTKFATVHIPDVETPEGFPYEIVVWDDFAAKLDDGSLSIHASDAWIDPVPRWNTGDTIVTATFTRRLTTAARRQLAEAIGRWFSTTGRAGVLSEARVRLSQPRLECYPKAIQFRVDARGCGQHTFNWLVLQLLTLCRVNVMGGVLIKASEAIHHTIRSEYGISDENRIEEPINVED